MMFAEISHENQRAYVASYLNYDPNSPDTWDDELIDRLVTLYVEHGEKAFVESVLKLNGR